MSHLHITDDLLQWQLALLGYLITLLVIGYILVTTKKEELFNNIAKLGIMAALMLIVMSIPLGIPFHLNLSILTALIIGPKLGFISILLVNIILATFGHGGITVVGLNTLIMGSEVFVGYYLFSFLLTKGIKWQYALFTTVLIALIISASLMVTIVRIGGIEPAIVYHSCDHDHGEHVTTGEDLTYSRFAMLVLGIVLFGSIIEALIILVIVNYFRKIRPDYLLKGGF
ncbi:energy-coupling factor ABC transporter permease [Anaerobranca gottschalkii]|uniref:Cobalt/nickel transport system permease protein n=1 Tax=Anaerobranca gottschalkii DSM 13577 TaxID=1120990 RepID=A0A1H9YA24_9FIRM|nr:energy-coupling factor ABC transporter permease [Anaerobranca gottschalkii]SES65291.1 cobalt/nickel transport system permease protein [Anaerobranca gottschalkii DSM 13577]